MQTTPTERRRRATLLIVALLVAVPLSGVASGAGEKAGDFLWIRQFGSPDNDAGEDVAAAADSVYVAGTATDALPGQTHEGGTDAFLRKVDLDGNAVWTRQFGTPGTGAGDFAEGVATTATGVYVAGRTTGELPGQTSEGSTDAFLRKYDPDGNELWTVQFGTSASDAVNGVAANATAVYVAGETGGTLGSQSSAGGQDAFLRAYDPDGNELWTHQFGSASSEAVEGVAVDASGIYVGGWTNGELPGQTSAGSLDAFVRKVDADGNETWTRQFGTSSGDVAFDVAAGASRVYVVGRTDGGLSGPSAGGLDAFLRSYDADGNELWTHQFGTASEETAEGVAANASGAYVAGWTEGALSSPNLGGRDAFLRKVDPDGSAVWTLQFGTSAADIAEGVAAAAHGVYAAGRTDGVLSGTGAGGRDAFTGRLAETPDAPASLTATAGDGRVALAWDPPPFDGYLPVTAYRVYRGTQPTDLQLVAVLDDDLRAYVDRDVTNGVEVHYAVGAVNGAGEGPPSPLAAATPRGPPLLTVTSPADGTVTNDPIVNVAGTTEADATVTINGTGVSVDAAGGYNLTVTLPDGDHAFAVEATNPLGMTTAVTVTVTVDTAAPALTLAAPAEGATLEVPTVTVSGTTEPGVDLVVNGVVVAVPGTGAFRVEVALHEGSNAITATATDAAGNVATVTVTVTFANPADDLRADLEETQQQLEEAIEGLNRSNAQIAAQGQQLLAAVLGLGAALAALLVVVFLVLRPRLGRGGAGPPDGGG